jgi:hypothetical protein
MYRWIVVAVLLLAWVADADAGQAARCRRACGAAISNCVSTTGLRRRVCKRRLVRACRRHGFAACELTPSTTTTQPLPTTTSTSSTTTTSTSTTLPVTNYAGDWSFVGSLSEDSCGTSGGLAETFTIAQDGSDLTGSIGSLPGVGLSGAVTVDGFQLSGSFLDSTGCTVMVALVAQDDGNVVLTAGTGFDLTCALSSCRSIWVGTLRRL